MRNQNLTKEEYADSADYDLDGDAWEMSRNR